MGSVAPRVQVRSETIREAARRAGILGMGGGGFPMAVKLNARADTVIANGAECEPLLWSDKQLVLRRASEVVDGLLLAARAVGAERAVLAVKGAYPEVLEAASRAVAEAAGGPVDLSVHELPNVYPAGDEFTLVQEVCGRTIPELGLPLDVGVVVSNVASLAALSRSFRAGEPVVARYVTVTGEVARPGVYEVPVGTRIQDLVAAAGGATVRDPRYVLGGPMMGSLAPDGGAVVTKTCSGVLVLPPDHHVVRDRQRDIATSIRMATAACCLCSECTAVCPRNALGHRIFPDRLMRAVAGSLDRDLQAYLGAALCCECGLCTLYGCPMGLDPRGMNVAVKAKLRASGLKLEARPANPDPWWNLSQVPVPRLTARLDLSRYEAHLEFLGPVTVREVEIPLKQGPGEPARPLVSRGDRVSVGQLVAEAPGRIGGHVHASVAGRVLDLDSEAVRIG